MQRAFGHRHILKKSRTHMKQQAAMNQDRCHMKRWIQKSVLKLAVCSLRPCVCKLGNCCLNRDSIFVASVCLDVECPAGHWLRQALLLSCATPNLKNENPSHLVLFASFVFSLSISVSRSCVQAIRTHGLGIGLHVICHRSPLAATSLKTFGLPSCTPCCVVRFEL